MSTDYVQYDFKNGKDADSFLLKVTDDRIEDLLEVKHTERAKPDACLEYRLENGAVKEEFIGKEVDEFLSAQLRERGENCRIDKYNVKESTFRNQKMLENMLTFRGESTGLRFLKSCNETLRHETRHFQNLKMLRDGCAKG